MAEDRTGRFKGKTAVITGGASGIGWATVQRRAIEQAETIIIIDRNGQTARSAVENLQQSGTKANCLETDLLDRKAV
mgnify:CR=1 FL=1